MEQLKEAVDHIHKFSATSPFVDYTDGLFGFTFPHNDNSTPRQPSNVEENLPAPTVCQLERKFLEYTKVSKDRNKKMKSFIQFLSDLGRAHGTFSKELAKLSSTALHYSGEGHSSGRPSQGLSSLFSSHSETSSSNPLVDSWWLAIHVSLQQLSSDNDKLSDSLVNDVSEKFSRMYEENVALEKTLSAEGSKELSQWRECLALHDSKEKERDKYKDKVDIALDRVSQSSVSLLNVNPVDNNNKMILKFRACEEALKEQKERLKACEQAFIDSMPKILSEYNKVFATAILEMKNLLLRVAEIILSGSERSYTAINDMRLLVESSTNNVIARVLSEGKTGYSGIYCMLYLVCYIIYIICSIYFAYVI